ncbi:MAG: protein kinase [Gemmatimonadaceae bacterium]|nr:protein kinase [Gemmatimonadaceae bacterium]
MTVPETLRTALADRYELLRELGAGGMATVYLARDLKHNRQVAVKVLRADLAAALGQERFLREIRIAAGLQHPHILPLYDSGEAAGALYYIMPYVNGETLRARMTRSLVPVAEAQRILREIARALAYAHARGIVHRDIKPENVLLEPGVAYVADFGIAKAVDAARTDDGHGLTTAGLAIGTPAYMAPEQALGAPVDARTDLYAWGVLAYELLSGAHPFASRTTAPQLVAAHLSETPARLTPRPGLSPALIALIAQTLAKSPDERPASADELVAALEATHTAGAIAEGSAGSPRTAGTRRTAALVVSALVAGLVLFAVLRGRTGNGVPSTRAETPPGERAAPSLVVLPFTNYGGVPENEIFADGMTEDVITHLSTAGGLTVISRTSAMAYKGSTKSVTDIAAELGVTSVLEGSVRRVGSRVRVVAQLVDAQTRANRWAGTFDRELVDVFSIQSEVAQAIADTLRATLHPEARRQMALVPTRDTLAYQLYLQGRALAERRTSGAIRQALVLYDSAVGRDSSFALAYAQKALDLAVLPSVDTTDPRPMYMRAREAAKRAVALDPSLTEAHLALGVLEIVGGYDWAVSLRELDLAVASGAGNSRVHLRRAMLMCALRRDSAVAAEVQEAVRLDPMSGATLQSAGSYLFCARRTADALAMMQRAAAIDPGNRLIYATLQHAAWTLGDVEQIIASTNSMARAEGGQGIDPVRARAAARHGLAALARFMLAENRAPQAVRSQIIYHAVLNDRDAVMADLRRRYARRDPALYWVVRVPILDRLHDDPRLIALLRDMHLDP